MGDVLPRIAASLVCAGSAACMDGIKKLLLEICELFPDSPYKIEYKGYFD